MKKIITIARQFGAGGGEIGRRVAKELGIEFYDKDLILKTAKASANLTPAEVRRWEERMPKDFGFTQSLFDFYNRPLGDRLWDAQVTAIRQLADQESCVILGRNADFILREFDHCLHVFCHASFQWRFDRMRNMVTDNPTDEELRVRIQSVDRSRRNNCQHYTGRTYGMAENFDLTLNTSHLGIDRATELVLKAAESI